ncbi:hypothetical protein ACT3TI_11445 [Psychrobacter sp. AOP22-C1-22]|nr:MULTISPECIES: hypothetical protein [unclassified Psychrobacter]
MRCFIRAVRNELISDTSMNQLSGNAVMNGLPAQTEAAQNLPQ